MAIDNSNIKYCISLLESDLKNFIKDLQEIIEDSTRIDDDTVVKNIANHILILQEHGENFKHQKGLKSTSNTLLNLIKTPWGAPFVSELTLVEAANEVRGKSENALPLKNTLKQIHFYFYKHEFTLLEALILFDQELSEKAA